MIPKIKVNIGEGYDPVELQQVIDTDLLTKNKTVVGAINELLDKVDDLDLTSGFAPANGALLELITQEMIDQWNSGQENTIEKIFANGVEVPIVNKEVYLSIPTFEEHNHDGVYLKADEPIPKELIPYNIIEKIFANDVEVPIVNNEVHLNIPTSFEHNHDDVYLKADTPIPEELLPGNIVEVFKIAGAEVPLENKTFDIPVATATKHGVVKSSSGANQVSITADGTMRVGVISTSTLKVPIGEELVLNGGTSNGSEIVYAIRINNIGYESLAEAVSNANYGDVVTLEGDVDLGTSDKDHLTMSAENVTLDTNGATLSANGSNGAIKVSGGSTTITGNGTVAATLGSDNYSMAVWASSGKVVIENGIYQNVTDGSDRGTDLIYASGDAQIEITGGTFIAAKPEWTLNCKDNDYKAGTANIIVKGGSFYKFDPANNNTEGPGTNYVAEGYRSIMVDDYYVVKPIS